MTLSSTTTDLESLPGLESAKRLVASLAAGSAVQAVLFYGIEGSGKKRLAQILAKAWLCQRPVSSAPLSVNSNSAADASLQVTAYEPRGRGGISHPQPPPSLTNQSEGGGSGACGECQACLAFDRGRSVDLLWIEPQGASRIIRLAAISPAEEDDDYPVSAQMFLRTPPLSARNKVVVIEDAERLNPRAANSLLKTLEEPPPPGRFILLTESVGSILPTILSRCVAVACEVPESTPGFEAWALALANGGPGRAAELQEFGGVYRPLYDFALSLPQRPKAEALVAAEEFAGLADALQAARKMGARAADAEALQVLATAYGLSPSKRAEVLQAIIEAHRRVLGNANAGSVFDALFAIALG